MTIALMTSQYRRYRIRPVTTCTLPVFGDKGQTQRHVEKDEIQSVQIERGSPSLE